MLINSSRPSGRFYQSSRCNMLTLMILNLPFRREKALEGKSKISHSVHCPFFPDDKQEFWWCYIADRKNHALITPPNHVTSLIDREEVELKFTAPQKPGTFLPFLIGEIGSGGLLFSMILQRIICLIP